MTDSDTTPPPADRTLTWWPLLGALVIAAIVAVVIFAVGAGDNKSSGSQIEADGALACPSLSTGSEPTVASRVPAVPSGIDGRAALVPDTTPRHVAICRFEAPPEDAPGKSVDTARDGRVVLTAGNRAAATALHKAAKSKKGVVCAQFIGPGKPSYLMGFTFTTGVVWVWVPGNHCSVATNGQFSTDDDLATAVSQAYAAKKWIA